MTITRKFHPIGSRAICRRALSADPRLPLHNALSPTDDALVTGNMAIGRSGQRMVVDNLDIIGTFGAAGSAASQFTLRDTIGAAIQKELHFWIGSFTGSELVNQILRIRKLGYVPDPVDNSEREVANRLGVYGQAASSTGETGDAIMQVRYLGRDEAAAAGCKKGAWGSIGLNKTGWPSPATLLPAPGVGLYNRIHTLIVIAAGDTDGESIVIGTNATPSTAPVRRFFSDPGVNGFRVSHIATDTDIATPENTPFVASWGDSFGSAATTRGAIIVGAEVALIANHNFANLTGAPQ